MTCKHLLSCIDINLKKYIIYKTFSHGLSQFVLNDHVAASRIGMLGNVQSVSL